MAAKQQPRIAVLLPCYNEEAAIGATVEGFHRALPEAEETLKWSMPHWMVGGKNAA